MSSSLFARVGGLVLLALLLTIAPVRATEPSEPTPAGPFASMVLRLGRVPFAGPGEVVRKIGWMQDYLKKAVGVAEVKLVFSRDRNYESLMTKVGAGEVDIAWLSTVAYLRGRDRYRLQPLVRPIRGNATSYRGIIIVRKDSGVKTLADLRGKRIGWVDPESSSGYIFPRALLLQAGLDPARDLREERFLQKHDAVVWNVFLGKVDAGACFDDARKLLGNPLMIERLDVIGRTEPIPNEPIVCRSDLPAPLIARLREAFLALDAANPEHRAYLTIDADDFQGFVAATDEDYESARRLLATVDAAAKSAARPAALSPSPPDPSTMPVRRTSSAQEEGPAPGTASPSGATPISAAP